MVSAEKIKRIYRGLYIWRDEGGVGTFNYVPRFGKTLVGLHAIHNVLKKHKINVLVVVPSEIIKYHWEASITNFDANLTNNVSIYSIHKLANMPLKRYGLVIFDEIHKYLTGVVTSRTFISICNNSTFKLGLTGSPPKENSDAGNLLKKYVPIIDTISESVAIANNWISKFVEYNYVLPMEKADAEIYTLYTRHIKETFEIFDGAAQWLNNTKFGDYNIRFTFNSDYDVIKACQYGANLITGKKLRGKEVAELYAMSKGWSNNLDLSIQYNENLNNFYSPINLIERVKKFNHFVKLRNELINDNSTKLVAITNILNLRPTEKVMIFTESINFAEIVNEVINNNNLGKSAVYHSQIKKQAFIDPMTGDYIRKVNGEIKEVGKTVIKRKLIEGFRANKLNILVSVKSLDEGFDISDVTMIIISSGTINPIQQKQRTARAKTIDPNNINKNAIIINLVFDDITYNGELMQSRDMAKLINRQYHYEHLPKWVKSISNYLLKNT